VFMGRMFRSSTGIHWRGRIHKECGTDDAMLHLKRSLELNTQSQTAMSLSTQLLDEMGCYKEALLNASRLIEMAPQLTDG
jgi:hypothetical protein